ncbi:MAG: cellulase N-terminal Ig-like domain-containing protein [Anaerolineae bacterium]
MTAGKTGVWMRRAAGDFPGLRYDRLESAPAVWDTLRRLLMELLLVCGLSLLLLLGTAVHAQDDSAAADEGFISVNQTGYYPNGVKIAVYPTAQATDQTFEWALVDEASGATVASGQTLPGFHDEASGDYVHLIDFSDYVTPGRYVLKVDGASSVPFASAATSIAR